MKVAVIGPGAMGCLFGGFLAEAGNEVWLLDKSDRRAALLEQEGVRLEGIGGSRRVPVRVGTDPHAIGQADLVLVWVKAYDTVAATEGLPPLVGARTWVLSLQNGLGNLEALSAVVDPRRILGGTTAYGATLLSDGCSRHTGVGDTTIGTHPTVSHDEIAPITQAFADAGIAVTVARDLQCVLWSKLLVNATINPLTALTRVRNGDLPVREDTSRLIRIVTRECEQIASSAGISLGYDSLEQRVQSVCEATARNRSSMLQDVLRGRRTEIDAINGSVVSKAKAVGTQAPVNELLMGLVRAVGDWPSAD